MILVGISGRSGRVLLMRNDIGRMAESGLRHTFRKREGVIAPGVQIPLLPPEMV